MYIIYTCGGLIMKVFISWSGEISKKVAEILKKNIPCIIQNVEIFFSSNDIVKGENWDTKLTEELNQSNYGIVCLTSDNVNAPWIHFEAGALSKALDSKVSSLMINVVPSDIRGPLSRFQATKLQKEDFFLLMQSINKELEAPLSDEILTRTFDMAWQTINADINNVIQTQSNVTKDKKEKSNQENDKAIEEILALLRKQNNILSNPENIIPHEYMQNIFDVLTINLINNRNGIYSRDYLKIIRLLIELIEDLFRIARTGKGYELLQNIIVNSSLEKIIYEIQNYIKLHRISDSDIVLRINNIVVMLNNLSEENNYMKIAIENKK